MDQLDHLISKTLTKLVIENDQGHLSVAYLVNRMFDLVPGNSIFGIGVSQTLMSKLAELSDLTINMILNL